MSFFSILTLFRAGSSQHDFVLVQQAQFKWETLAKAGMHQTVTISKIDKYFKLKRFFIYSLV
jgi:hypothetical protein